MSTCLSVNVNKIATLRNARGGNIPNVVQVALDIEQFGADGITVHPRHDERHIKYTDVYALKEVITTEFNIEGYPDTRFMQMVCDVKPTQCTLVPDPPGVLTSNAGWDVLKHQQFLCDIIAKLKTHGIRVSLFIETDERQIVAAAQTGADRVELYTGPYAEQFLLHPEKALTPYIQAAKWAQRCGLGLNAGHDLNLQNLPQFAKMVTKLLEVSIGHALICDALYYGLQNTIQLYKRALD
ncbi:MAG: pyridoxine 5'-phosphate synthase [Sphingobacteriales bacterium]|jgi:pyridoxine 5-phosphate synthase|nr:pyridoxine 5'-phosphate synthase [Sphingobacteriales bacterium]MBP9141560.1 pyridoxine 5'-phosphate synthase [Chitinophagales bacterium]MDA0198663.1 pyridoxine 5'-phosphate synthase [Bacteroidota bacterium]MBK6889807.1 pyridoxine 5'-phosphate synthase [Sphingobacteriales bacterium]MBK7527675.1 pyridoxine 5'-phosphate synthase [Sphingobacteriales bacterium]